MRPLRGLLDAGGHLRTCLLMFRSYLDFVQLVDGVGDIAELNVDSDGDFLFSGSCPRHWKSPGVEQQPRMRELGYKSKLCTKSRSYRTVENSTSVRSGSRRRCASDGDEYGRSPGIRAGATERPSDRLMAELPACGRKTCQGHEAREFRVLGGRRHGGQVLGSSRCYFGRWNLQYSSFSRASDGHCSPWSFLQRRCARAGSARQGRGTGSRGGLSFDGLLSL